MMMMMMILMYQNGYLATPREGNYRLHSIVKYGCERGFWMAGEKETQSKFRS